MAAKKASKPRKKHVDRTKSVESGKGGGYNISDFRWSDVVPMAPEVKKDPHIPHPLGDG
jgi:hypothetical protein